MSRRWHSAEAAAMPPASDFASEILWETQAPVAIIDHAGHVEFSNPAFAEARLHQVLLDARGFLIDPAVEALRLAGLQGRPPTIGNGVRAVHSELAEAMVEVLGLHLVPGWSALIVHKSPPAKSTAADLPSADLLLHELKAPLLAVREALDRLTQECASQEPETLAAIARQSRAVNRLSGVLTSLGDLVRAREVTKGGYIPSHVDLSEVARDVHETFELLATANGYELQLDSEPGLPPIPGDRILLSRALANLVDNALKYSPPPGPVRVVTAIRGSLLVAEVWDSGPGIPPRDRQRVFEPFVRLVAGVNASSAGSGLGLAVVRSVVRAHGGSLSLESDAGNGTVFRLSFLIPGSDRFPGQM